MYKIFLLLLYIGANPALYSLKLMHYAQLELERIKSNVRPYHVPQTLPNPVEILENAYHLTTIDAQNEVSIVCLLVFLFFVSILLKKKKIMINVQLDIVCVCVENKKIG